MYIATFFNILGGFKVVAIILNKYYHISYLSSDWPMSSTIDQSDDSFQNGVWNIRNQENTFKIKTTSIFPVHGPASLILMSKYEVTEFFGRFPNNILQTERLVLDENYKHISCSQTCHININEQIIMRVS